MIYVVLSIWIRNAWQSQTLRDLVHCIHITKSKILVNNITLHEEIYDTDRCIYRSIYIESKAFKIRFSLISRGVRVSVGFLMHWIRVI